MTTGNEPAPGARGPAHITRGDGDSTTIAVPRCPANEPVLAKLRRLREHYGYFTRAELALARIWPRPIRFEDIDREDW